MVKSKSPGRRIFEVCDYVILGVAAVLCVLPLINVLAMSFSANYAVASNMVTFWPVQFTTASYEWTLRHPEFLTSFLVTLERVVIGVPINIILTILVAYPLSKESDVFRHRKYFVGYFFITMLFSGGLIPTFLVVRNTHIMDTVWALILPGAVSVWNAVIMLNFFRGLPKELEEAAFIDGAGQWKTLFMVYLPLSMPSVATITLFCIVGHWNSWFDGLIYMNLPQHYPLQSYLQTVVVNFDPMSIKNMTSDQLTMLGKINNKTTQTAQLFLASIPVLLVYPFLQRYFMTGLTLGSVKG